MISGRILIVSERQQVIAELEPILRADQHLPLTVHDAEEAVALLDEGIIPDVVISDRESAAARGQERYLSRFRALNRVGAHLVVTDTPGETGRDGAADERENRGTVSLARPFRTDEVRDAVEAAVRRVDRELVAMRGEMWREMGRMHRAMRDLQRETVRALAATIAARDPFMQGHASRVAVLSRRIAEAMALRAEEVEILEDAALLHEIGKVVVPIELLHKTTPLSADELDRIRAHPRAGADIVREVAALRRCASIIEHQGTDHAELHRVLDAGSPDFLLTGILRVADVYDAMVSPRSYRGPMPREYWERHLRDGSGARYHPRAVGTFFQVMGTGGSPFRRPEARTA